MMFEFIALMLAMLHFGIPLAYYWYLRRWLVKPWGINFNPDFKPKISIIIPTYNEVDLIKGKLDNIYEQVYPRGGIEVIVVDSASSDGTYERILEWIRDHPDINVKAIREDERRGKGFALNTALKYASGDIVVITDVDSLWPSRSTLLEVTRWFSNPIIGAISCIKRPTSPGVMGVEEGYRNYYNIVRIAESKLWSTPVFHGELAAFRRSLLDEISGFPTDIGADDSHTATLIALRGYRAITPETLECVELVPRRGYHMWRIRRAQHLIQHFLRTLRLRGGPRRFKKIILVEAYLHLLNPWLLPVATLLLAIQAIKGSIVALTLLAIGLVLLTLKAYRTWITTQLYLIIAMIRNMWTKEITWKRVQK